MTGERVTAEGLRTWDGNVISLAEIDKYFQDVVPLRFPKLKEHRIDWDSKAIRKALYLVLTLPERLEHARSKGKRIVHRWGSVNPTEQYYASGVIPVSVFAFMRRAVFDGSVAALARLGRTLLSEDACPLQSTMHAALVKGLMPVDMVFPYVGPWCYQTPFNYEALRGVVPSINFVDHLMFPGWPGKGESAFEYLVAEVRNSVKLMAGMADREVTNEDVWAHIALEKKLRGKMLEFRNCMAHQPPPFGAISASFVTTMGNDWYGDPVACGDVLETACAEAKERIAKGEKGAGLSDDPIRLLCLANPPLDMALFNIIEDLGGAVVDSERMPRGERNPIVDDDPYRHMARNVFTVSTSQPARKRGLSISSQVQEMGIHGVIYNYNYGCRNLGLTARMVCDVITEQTGVPYLILEHDLPGQNRGQYTIRIQAFLETLRGGLWTDE